MKITARLKLSAPHHHLQPSAAIEEHIRQLRSCTLCPNMQKPVVCGYPVLSRVLLVGQAPGPKEPLVGKPFAWTAGKTLFKWFHETSGIEEEAFRRHIYMSAVCRCFPGKVATGGDRVPDETEVQNCRHWLEMEVKLLKPLLVLPVGKLAIQQFIECPKLDQIIGKIIPCTAFGEKFDLVPLPHPSGASPWHRTEPGITLLHRALRRINTHPAFIQACK